MKKSILLVLLYLLIQTIAGGILALLITQWWGASVEFAMVVALLAADIIMAGILIQKGYASDKIFISDFIASLTDFLPNWLESTFSNIEGSWLGVLAIAIIGPVLEEMLFRGAVTTELLKNYSPEKAILFSALIFGIFHINPAQVLNAFLLGLLLAWLFYKTRSLIPGILIHILNNSLSVYFTQTFPEADTLSDIIGNQPYYISLILAIVLLVVSVRSLDKEKG